MARAKYKHMLPHEVTIWDRYIEKHGLPAGSVDYDVHLGEGMPAQPGWPRWMVRVVQQLSTHRADVVIERPGEVIIVEVKGIAGMGAVGQLLGYEALWLRDRGASRPVRLWLVCESVESDMLEVFGFYEIEVFLV